MGTIQTESANYSTMGDREKTFDKRDRFERAVGAALERFSNLDNFPHQDKGDLITLIRAEMGNRLLGLQHLQFRATL